MSYSSIIYRINRREKKKFEMTTFFLSGYNYFKDLPESLINQPFQKPSDDDPNHQFLMSEWKQKCLKSKKWRAEVKLIVFDKINQIYDTLCSTRDEKFHYFFIPFYHYKYFYKSNIDKWIEVWETVEYNSENLESLLIFKNILIDFIKIKERKFINMEFNYKLLMEMREITKESRYWSRNAYKEGGGGDEWSDSSSFW